MSEGDIAWFAERTAGAPVALRDRAAASLRDAAGGGDVARLARAGRRALDAAIDRGSDRAAALDLLAADALITLALLRAAEREPERLGAIAAGLRRDVSQAT